MRELFIVLFLLPILAFGQQLNFTSGTNLNGTDLNETGFTYLDTTAGTTNNAYFDLGDYYFSTDFYPIVAYDTLARTAGDTVSGSYVYGSSNYFYLGTLYTYWDFVGVKAPTTDSLKWTIKAYPGVYTTASRALASVKWGTAVTLRTTAEAGDEPFANNVYVSTVNKALPPEVIKIEFAPVDKKTNDDSLNVYWRLVYPQVVNPYEIQIDRGD